MFSTEKKKVGKKTTFSLILGWMKCRRHNILCQKHRNKKTAAFLANLWLTERLSLFYNEGHAMFWHSLF